MKSAGLYQYVCMYTESEEISDYCYSVFHITYIQGLIQKSIFKCVLFKCRHKKSTYSKCLYLIMNSSEYVERTSFSIFYF